MKFLNINLDAVFILILLFVSIILRFYNINLSDYWGDEITTFFISDPKIPNHITNQRIISTENTGGYYFLLKLVFKSFGYYPEYGRYVVAIIGSSIPVIFFYIIRREVNFYYAFIISFTVAVNIFLISESQEVRVQTFYCFSAILTIFFFQNILRKKSFFNCSMFIFFGVLTCWLQIFSLIIIFSLFIYSFFLTEKFFLFLLLTIIVMLGLFINYELLIKLFTIQYIAIGYPESDFYYDYFFKYFFGSRFTGRIVFILYLILLLLNLKKILLNKGFIFLVTILIISAYLLPLIYTYVRRPCLIPRYIIFVVPLIIFSIFYFISEFNHKFKKLILFSILILITSNTFYSIYNQKNQKVLRLNQYLSNNNFGNVKIHLYAINEMSENYFLNYKSLKEKNIFIQVIKKVDSVKGIKYLIISKPLLDDIRFKYDTLYKDPENYLIKFN